MWAPWGLANKIETLCNARKYPLNINIRVSWYHAYTWRSFLFFLYRFYTQLNGKYSCNCGEWDFCVCFFFSGVNGLSLNQIERFVEANRVTFNEQFLYINSFRVFRKRFIDSVEIIRLSKFGYVVSKPLPSMYKLIYKHYLCLIWLYNSKS